MEHLGFKDPTSPFYGCLGPFIAALFFGGLKLIVGESRSFALGANQFVVARGVRGD